MKIAWISVVGGGWKARAGTFNLHVYWSSTKGEKWRAQVADRRLPDQFETLELAKQGAVEALRKLLSSALAELPDPIAPDVSTVPPSSAVETLVKNVVEWCSKNGQAESRLLYGKHGTHYVFTFPLFDHLSKETQIKQERIAEWFNAAQEKRGG